MKRISRQEVKYITGSFAPFVQAFLVGVSVFVAPALVRDKAKEYNNHGRNWSQAWWDKNYPYDPNSSTCYGPNC